MRGVALGICPDATLVDITHEIVPQDIVGGALELAAAVKYFPAGTVFLAVVDPGVGSMRRAIAAEAGPYMFVAPDNGLLTMVFRQFAPARIVELTERAYALPAISRTFEGRDRFAPAAAWLAKGTPLTSLGQILTDWQKVDVPAPTMEGAQLAGVVVRVDRFGNLVTNIDRQTFDRLASSGAARIAIAYRHLISVVSTYAEVEPGTLCALFGSTDHLEIAIAGGSAAERLGLTRGAPVVVRFDASA
jgi:S-adenosylmethionine hydrolase